MTTTEIILIFAVIILIGYFIKALTGFASGIFSVPLLVLFFDIRLVVPVISILSLVSGLLLFPSIKKKIYWKGLFYVLAGTFFGHNHRCIAFGFSRRQSSENNFCHSDNYFLIKNVF
ncbi:MAG: sulfite exporter TauE/SafE family protein [Nanoarchaeota archaeon]|nr:sulfite exporter TauE/SafE family protein [Nanoarchaeota archaeon]MBU1322387.1 sulfite exporter TauE/SafE family protein [Nanoarchaeota archaeon]MBU1596938.1 sulfite exporter TauE/SafE family protein [Nanoarchaeota archaeon]MBU2442345.1 sulfite exporter TauE/SafE family protein [Nanoarchaeota archaeon]